MRKQKEMRQLIDNGSVSVDEAMVSSAREWASIALPKGRKNLYGMISDGTSVIINLKQIKHRLCCIKV